VSTAANLFSPGALVALALAVSAACVAPVVALAFWPRAGDREALAAVVAGLVGLLAALAAGGGAARVEVCALASLAGATLGLAAGAVSALSSGTDRAGAQAFVARILRGDGQALEPDKGA
jgi:cation/acetate symporter